jgi:hypothetical protein
MLIAKTSSSNHAVKQWQGLLKQAIPIQFQRPGIGFRRHKTPRLMTAQEKIETDDKAEGC